MKVLITGAAGFLGSHLVQRFLADGDSVTGLDDFSTGSPVNLEEFKESENFVFFNHDVRQPYFFDVDLILNFACPASPLAYQSDPVRTMETNFLGIVNALHLSRATNATVLQASTSEVYGDPQVTPQQESYWGNVNPVGVRSCYDEGKRAAETLCADYRRQFGTDSRLIRIFNTFGPKMAIGDGRVVSNFIVQALQEKPLTVYGDGTQTRSFCYVDDLVEGIHKMSKNVKEISGPINLGNPREHTMLELANLIVSLLNSKSEIVSLPLPHDDPKQRNPDISLARKELDWQPRVSLEEGILKTAAYFMKIL
jgi:UDP-glucuronate decarboxylase